MVEGVWGVVGQVEDGCTVGCGRDTGPWLVVHGGRDGGAVY